MSQQMTRDEATKHIEDFERRVIEAQHKLANNANFFGVIKAREWLIMSLSNGFPKVETESCGGINGNGLPLCPYCFGLGKIPADTPTDTADQRK